MRNQINKRVLKTINRLNQKDKERLVEVLEEIEKVQEILEIKNCIKLQGNTIYYRIRKGNFRLFFYMKNDIVMIEEIRTREDSYKKK